MTEWFENESFWREMYAHMFPDERFEKAQEEIEGVYGLVGFEGKTALDLCCGPGRHAIAMAKRGVKVTAVDRTRFLLDKARERAQAAQVDVEWVLSDMREFARPVAFDLAISMFTSFGYFEDRQDNLRVLRNVYQSLRPGGACLIEVAGKERLAKQFQPTLSTPVPGGGLLVQRQKILDDWERISSEWILIENGAAKSFTVEVAVYSGQELKALLLEAGFAEVHLYGDLNGAEYGLEATRLVAVGRK